MKHIFFGILIGAFLAILPIFSYNKPTYIKAQWQNNFSNYQVSVSPFISTKSACFFPIKTNNSIETFSITGSQVSHAIPQENFFSMSGSGKYYALYQKIGKTIELHDTSGARFWQIESSQYPYLSYNAKLVLLLVADLSSVKVMDINANMLDTKINGKFCTNIVFSKNSDNAVIGFLDGSVFEKNEKGTIAYNSKMPQMLSVKSCAISDNGNFIAIHYGNTKQDNLMIINIENKKEFSTKLKNVHVAKTAITINNDGQCAILNINKVCVFSKKAKKLFSIQTKEQMVGQSSIVLTKNKFYAFAYKNNENTCFTIANQDGKIFLDKVFNEKAMEVFTKENAIIARGIDNLYAWSIVE